MKNLFSLVGKVALVTGGSRGIGAMIARGFVENGVKTYITSRKEKELNETAEALSEFGTCIALPSDLSTICGIRSVSERIQALEPKLDILVNNAGATWGEKIDIFPESGWDKVMDINVKSLFFLTQNLLPILRLSGSQRDPARVINIASINAFVYSNLQNYSYTASKAAVVQLTRHLAAELVSDKINVNAIAPGLFPSNMTAFAIQEDEVGLSDSIPRARMGNANDAAGTAIYLSAMASAWMTGQTIVLDGGVVASAH